MQQGHRNILPLLIREGPDRQPFGHPYWSRRNTNVRPTPNGEWPRNIRQVLTGKGPQISPSLTGDGPQIGFSETLYYNKIITPIHQQSVFRRQNNRRIKPRPYIWTPSMTVPRNFYTDLKGVLQSMKAPSWAINQPYFLQICSCRPRLETLFIMPQLCSAPPQRRELLKCKTEMGKRMLRATLYSPYYVRVLILIQLSQERYLP